MIKDPIVEEIHEIRRKRAEKYHYNLDEMFEALREAEKKSARQYVSFPPKRAKPELEQSHK
jgi:hypothetical protein